MVSFISLRQVSMYIGRLFWIAVGLCLAAPAVICLQAWNVREFWYLWLVGLGLVLGGVLGASARPWPYAVSAGAGAAVPRRHRFQSSHQGQNGPFEPGGTLLYAVQTGLCGQIGK